MIEQNGQHEWSDDEQKEPYEIVQTNTYRTQNKQTNKQIDII